MAAELKSNKRIFIYTREALVHISQSISMFRISFVRFPKYFLCSYYEFCFVSWKQILVMKNMNRAERRYILHLSFTESQ